MKGYNLIYMAKPTYGGWVTFTAHLALKYNYKLFKIGKRTEYLKSGEPRLRDFGYGVKYQNISIDDAKKMPEILITAIDKHKYEYISHFPDNISIVIHDPTEVKGKSTQAVLDNLPRFNILTIRESVKKYISEKYNLDSTFKYHPFYEYISTMADKTNRVAISRIDFDKHTDIILKANKLLSNSNKITVYGAKNDLYVYHHLANKLKLDINENYGGKFKKSFIELNDILNKAMFAVDLSAIKNDGGGSQYTFLEAIYQNAVLVLNKKWVENCKTPFINGVNCFIIENEMDLAKIMNGDINTNKISANAKKLLMPHVDVVW